MRLGFLLFVFPILISSCETPPASFVEMGHSPSLYGNRPYLTDALTINYANEVASYLRRKAKGARITREMSDSASMALAKLAAPGSEIFGFSMRTGSVLGLAGTSIVDAQGIFNAKGRSEAMGDGVRFIEEALMEYLSFNQNPSDTFLTQNGVTLVQRTTASVHLVEKTLIGTIPTPEDMQKATEPMSAGGAQLTTVGSVPRNNIPANPTAAHARAVYQHMADPKPVAVRQQDAIPEPPPSDGEQLLIDFTKDYRAFSRNSTISDQKKTEVYRKTLSDARMEVGERTDISAIFLEASAAERKEILEAFRSNIPTN